MVKSDTTWFIMIAIVVAYILVPPFQDGVNNIFNGVSGAGPTGVTAEICVHDTVTMQMQGEKDPNIIMLINGDVITTVGDAVLVSHNDFVELFYKDESNKYWDEKVPCKPTFGLDLTVPQDIKTSYVSEVVEEEDILALNYGAGGTILPELDGTEYDFENLGELNLGELNLGELNLGELNLDI